MNEHQRGVSGGPASHLFNMVCPAARQSGCSLRTAALYAGQGRNRAKESLTECEIKIFLSLARGHRIALRDHETGELLSGWVDLTFPDHGFVWVITDIGERKLLSMGVHTVWRPDQSGACSNVGREACHLEDDRALTIGSSPSD